MLHPCCAAFWVRDDENVVRQGREPLRRAHICCGENRRPVFAVDAALFRLAGRLRDDRVAKYLRCRGRVERHRLRRHGAECAAERAAAVARLEAAAASEMMNGGRIEVVDAELADGELIERIVPKCGRRARRFRGVAAWAAISGGRLRNAAIGGAGFRGVYAYCWRFWHAVGRGDRISVGGTLAERKTLKRPLLHHGPLLHDDRRDKGGNGGGDGGRSAEYFLFGIVADAANKIRSLAQTTRRRRLASRLSSTSPKSSKGREQTKIIYTRSLTCRTNARRKELNLGAIEAAASVRVN